MKRDESYLQSLCESYLTMRHIPYLHLTTAIHRKVAGRFYTFPVPGMTDWPDLLIFMPGGKPQLVELKSAKGKLSAGQVRKFAELKKAGYPVGIIRDFEEFEFMIKGWNFNNVNRGEKP